MWTSADHSKNTADTSRRHKWFPDEMTIWRMSAGIPYWWRDSTQIWVVLLIGLGARETCFSQSEAPPRSGRWYVISSVEFLPSLPQTSFCGEPSVALGNISCFLRACLHGGGGPKAGEVTRLGGVPACPHNLSYYHPTYHVNGLPHLHGVPQLHVNGPSGGK